MAKTSIIDGIRTQNLTEAGVEGHYTRIRQTMLAADVCFATTEELAFHMRQAGKPTLVLPNGFNQYVTTCLAARRHDWRPTAMG